jgi:guanylate kinase
MSKLVVVVGQSGSGKTLLAEKLGYNKVITATTRIPREGEINGKDYYFLSKGEFENKIKNNDFIEYVKLGEKYYGTPISSLSDNENQIIILDSKGVESLLKNNIDCIVIYMQRSIDKIKESLMSEIPENLSNQEKAKKINDIIERLNRDSSEDSPTSKSSLNNLGINYTVIDNNDISVSELIEKAKNIINNVESKENEKNIEEFDITR